MKHIQATLVLVENNNKILMVQKNRGLGEGKYNLPGGHKQDLESFKECAFRETLEETGILASNLERLGSIYFVFKHKNITSEVQTFYSKTTDTTLLKNDEECTPEWVDKDKIPYEKMMPADSQFMPYLLQKQKDCFIQIEYDENWNGKLTLLAEPLEQMDAQDTLTFHDLSM
jgi:8-oxo-dGTP diphosphatase